MNTKIVIIVGLIIGFFLIGYNIFKDSLPEAKNERIYKELKVYMPYELEKRVGGYSIVSKITGIKEKPPASLVFKRLDELEKIWGNEFLTIEGNTIIVKNKSNEIIGKVKIESEKEKQWVKSFFQLR